MVRHCMTVAHHSLSDISAHETENSAANIGGKDANQGHSLDRIATIGVEAIPFCRGHTAASGAGQYCRYIAGTS